jgi:hypothetical protein
LSMGAGRPITSSRGPASPSCSPSSRERAAIVVSDGPASCGARADQAGIEGQPERCAECRQGTFGRIRPGGLRRAFVPFGGAAGGRFCRAAVRHNRSTNTLSPGALALHADGESWRPAAHRSPLVNWLS